MVLFAYVFRISTKCRGGHTNWRGRGIICSSCELGYQNALGTYFTLKHRIEDQYRNNPKPKYVRIERLIRKGSMYSNISAVNGSRCVR